MLECFDQERADGISQLCVELLYQMLFLSNEFLLKLRLQFGFVRFNFGLDGPHAYLSLCTQLGQFSPVTLQLIADNLSTELLQQLVQLAC